MSLHWHTDENPCLLCGVPVAPESWIGGVMQDRYGGWVLKTADGIDPDDGGYVPGDLPTFMPIFPPAGWAGKTDAELREAVFGQGYEIQISSDVALMGPGALPSIYTNICALNTTDPERVSQRILDEQNALTLYARLAVKL